MAVGTSSTQNPREHHPGAESRVMQNPVSILYKNMCIMKREFLWVYIYFFVFFSLVLYFTNTLFLFI